MRTKNFKKARSPEQKELDKKRRRLSDAIRILRGISIRLPLLIYGADVPIDKNFMIKMLLVIVDDASWTEFMPKSVIKEIFSDFIKYYDRDIFNAAVKKIQNLAKDADEPRPTDRVKKITEIFATFRNPDK